MKFVLFLMKQVNITRNIEIAPHPRPLPKKGGEWCSTIIKTLIAMLELVENPLPLPLLGKGAGGMGWLSYIGASSQ
jgi:hypothetical protein